MKARRGLVPFLPLTILVVTMLQGVATAYETISVAAAVPPIARQNVMPAPIFIAGLMIPSATVTTGAATTPMPNLVILTVPRVVVHVGAAVVVVVVVVVVAPSTPARG